MKQGKSYFTVILWILLAAIAAYFGYHVISSLYAPLMTATVTPYEAGAGYYASGFVVREEELLYSQYGTTVLSCAEGAHVAANDTVATGYRSEDARLRQTRMDELSGQIEQLQYAWSAVSSVYDQAALDADIADALAQLSRYLALRDMNSVSDLSPELKGLILRRTGSGADSGALQSRISALQAELDTLEAQSAGDTSAISAGRAGTFSAAVDGYEAVLTPERLMDMTVAEFEAVQPDEADAHAIGRLITSTTWYYACVVPASELSDVEEGDRATLTFVNRETPVPDCKVRDTQSRLTITTPALTLTYTKGGKFSDKNLKAVFRLNGREVVWTPGTEDPQNLMGTTRTLDGCDGRKLGREPMEQGLLSRAGWSVVDDSGRHVLTPDGSAWKEWVEARPAGDRQDLYLFAYGHDYK